MVELGVESISAILYWVTLESLCIRSWLMHEVRAYIAESLATCYFIEADALMGTLYRRLQVLLVVEFAQESLPVNSANLILMFFEVPLCHILFYRVEGLSAR